MLFQKRKQTTPDPEKKDLAEETFSAMNNDNAIIDYTKRTLSENITKAYKGNIYVWLACQHTAGAIQQPQFRIYRKDETGKSEPITKHPFNKIIENPNPFQTFSEILQMLAIFRRLDGLVYLWLQNDKLKQTQEIYVLTRSMVTANKDNAGIVTGYRLNGKQSVDIPLDQIICYRFNDPADVYGGFAPVTVGALQVDSARNVDIWNNSVFENGAIPAFVVEIDQKLQDGGERLRQAIKNLFSGARKAGTALVVDGGAKVKSIGTNHKDMAFAELKKMAKEDIANLMMIPLPLLSVDFAKYDNYRESLRIFWTINVIPELNYIAEGINRSVKTFKTDGVYLWYDLTGIEALKDSETEKFDRITKAVNLDLITLVDAGRVLGLPENPAIDDVTLSQHRGGYVAIIPDTPKARGRIEVKGVNAVNDINNAWIADILDEIAEDMQDDFAELYGEAINGSAQSWLVALNTTVNYNPMHQKIQNYINSTVGNKIVGINTTTKLAIRSQIAEGMSAGEGIIQIAERIGTVFAQASAGRCMTIARTETHDATQFGVLDAYSQSGLVEFKEWITERDEIVREDHVEMEGVTVGVDDEFNCAGFPCDYPGNTGVAELDINCRCTIGAVFYGNADEKQYTPEGKTIEWKRQDRLARSYEAKFARLYKKMFEEQQRKIAEYLH